MSLGFFFGSQKFYLISKFIPKPFLFSFLQHHTISQNVITEIVSDHRKQRHIHFLTASAASFAARKRRERCWFILALGATPSEWAREINMEKKWLE